MNEKINVQVNIDKETGDHYVKTVGQTLPKEGFLKLAEMIQERSKEVPFEKRVITLTDGKKKTCAYAIIYQNTGARMINFTKEESVYEKYGVVLEIDDVKDEVFLYVDPKIMKTHYDNDDFKDLFEDVVGLKENEEEENIRKIETYIRLMEKSNEKVELQTELHMENLIQLGALSLYLGDTIIQSSPKSTWNFKVPNEFDLSIKTIENSIFTINPLALIRSIYEGSEVHLLDVWEKTVSLTSTKLTPLIVKVMEEENLTQEQAVHFTQEALTSYFDEEIFSKTVASQSSTQHSLKAEDTCLCGSGELYGACCMPEGEQKKVKTVKFTEATGFHSDTVTVATIEQDGKIITLGKHYSGSGLCWWLPTSERHNISNVEEWKKLVLADAKLYYGF